MNEEGQDFERLRRALALKRYEIPPPRYFNELPGRITARLDIAAKEAPDSFWERMRRVVSERPAFATGAGIAAGCAVLAAVAMLSTLDNRPAGSAGIQPAASPANAVATVPAQPVDSLVNSNTNPGTELFQNMQPQAVPASHRTEHR